MSRRPPAASANNSEANKVRLKALVKLEPNKQCADCKRNKHPRWASWNLGVFVCIRCSGIHRGMGVHISRVKSVDLDSWTDEQTQNMIRWGNGRANKYYESKLAEGHVPNEAKIENFIRTKYDSKRWVMDGPMPDPSTLDDGTVGNDDVPLSIVKEEIKRTASQRNGTAPQPPQQRRQELDLFGDLEGSAPVRPNTTEPAVSRPPGPPKAPVAPPKQTKAGDSLLGMDFFGGPAQPARPSSTGASTPGVPGRADLKSSILSLYASKPAAPPQQPQQPQSNMSAFGGMQSPPLVSPTQQQPSNTQSFGGMNDAFGSLSFGQSPPQQQPKPSPFAGLSSPTGHSRQVSNNAKPALSGGSFFDTKPTQPSRSMPPPVAAPRKESFGGGDWGDFSSAAVSPPAPQTSAMKSPPVATSSSGMGDLFDMGSPPTQTFSAPVAPQPKPAAKQPPPINYSAFNLSQPAPAPAKPAQPVQSSTSAFSGSAMSDPWDSNDAWATPDPAPAPVQQPAKQTSTTAPVKPAPQPAPMQTSAFDSGGWGDMTSPSAPSTNVNTNVSGEGFSVQQDDDFGGWSHASPVATTPGNKPSGGSGGGGGVGGADLFDNPW